MSNAFLLPQAVPTSAGPGGVSEPARSSESKQNVVVVPVDKSPKENVLWGYMGWIILACATSFWTGAILAVTLTQGLCQDLESAVMWNPLAAFRSMQGVAANPFLAVLSPSTSVQAGIAATAATTAITGAVTWSVKHGSRYVGRQIEKRSTDTHSHASPRYIDEPRSSASSPVIRLLKPRKGWDGDSTHPPQYITMKNKCFSDSSRSHRRHSQIPILNLRDLGGRASDALVQIPRGTQRTRRTRDPSPAFSSDSGSSTFLGLGNPYGRQGRGSQHSYQLSPRRTLLF